VLYYGQYYGKVFFLSVYKIWQCKCGYAVPDQKNEKKSFPTLKHSAHVASPPDCHRPPELRADRYSPVERTTEDASWNATATGCDGESGKWALASTESAGRVPSPVSCTGKSRTSLGVGFGTAVWESSAAFTSFGEFEDGSVEPDGASVAWTSGSETERRSNALPAAGHGARCKRSKSRWILCRTISGKIKCSRKSVRAQPTIKPTTKTYSSK